MLRYIYTFFVGLFIALFVGVGVSVFYTAPPAPEPPIYYSKELSLSEQQAQAAFEVQQRQYNTYNAHYSRNVSMIALTAAVVIVIVALMQEKRLGVLSDGILLGGIFTVLYGIGRGLASDNNKYRFIVVCVGLVVTLVLGYNKFSHTGHANP